MAKGGSPFLYYANAKCFAIIVSLSDPDTAATKVENYRGEGSIELHWGYTGIMEKKMETALMGYIVFTV